MFLFNIFPRTHLLFDPLFDRSLIRFYDVSKKEKIFFCLLKEIEHSYANLLDKIVRLTVLNEDQLGR